MIRPAYRRSIPLAEIEDQLVAYLATFHLPDETVSEVVRLYERANDQRDDAERRRREIAGRIERIAEMYKWGDLTREAYRSERDRLEAELKTLQGTTDRAVVMAQAAALLRDLPAAWTSAAPEQRNALARLVFAEVEIKEDRVVAVVPQPDFAPFFLLHAATNDEADGDDNGAAEATPSTEVLNGRKRRGSDERLRHFSDGLGWIAEPGSSCVSRTGNEVALIKTARRKLTLDQESAIRALAKTKSLRSLAADFGVSHETVRSICSRAESSGREQSLSLRDREAACRTVDRPVERRSSKAG